MAARYTRRFYRDVLTILDRANVPTLVGGAFAFSHFTGIQRPTKDFDLFVRREHIDIAVIAVPAESAQPVLDQVVAAGVKAVLNFSPGTLKAPQGVKLKSVDLTVSLESLSFYLAQGIDPDPE